MTTSATGGRKKSGWYLNAPAISSLKTESHALDIPQPAHDIPVKNFIGHVMPKFSSTTYSTTTAAAAATA